MLPGSQRIAKLLCLEHEAACGYEPLAALGGSAARCGMGSVALVISGERHEPDSVIMAYAAEHDYVVATLDLDFSAILAATHGNKPSVVQIRIDDVSPRVIGNQIVDALRYLVAELEAGALVTIGRRQTRVRMLPLIPRE